MKLYELTSAYQQLLDLAAEGEDFQASLDELRGSIEEKAEAVAMVVKTLEAEADVITAECKKLQDKAVARGNSAKRLKDYLRLELEAVGIDQVKGQIFTIALQNNPPSVNVPTLEDVPAQYRMGTVRLGWAEIESLNLQGQAEASVNKRAILADFKATGESIPGVEIVQGKSLRIR